MVSRTERVKSCAKCGEPKPWSAYYAKARWPDGTMRQPHSRCKPCQHASRDQRQTWATLKADPERRAVERDRTRERYRRTHNVSPDRYRLKTPEAEERGGRMPVEPFAQWLATLGESSADIALRTGLADRKVRSYLSGESDSVPFDVVDGALLFAATDATLDDVYPNWLEAA